MSQIPDFSESKIQTVQSVVDDRYGKAVGLILADSEIKIDTSSEELSWCPAIFWTERGTNFIIVKIGDRAYRSMFYYIPDEQFGTGRESYDDMGDCVNTLLKLQADHEKESAGASSGKTGKDLN